MNRVISSLIEYLESKSACYELDEARQVLHLGMEAENARWRCLACQDDAGRFVFVSLLPINAPPARRVACAELFARVNAKLGLGHFDIDFKDGELGYRSSGQHAMIYLPIAFLSRSGFATRGGLRHLSVRICRFARTHAECTAGAQSPHSGQ